MCDGSSLKQNQVSYITLLFCSCCSSGITADNYETNLRSALEVIRQNVPRVFVNLVPMGNLSEVNMSVYHSKNKFVVYNHNTLTTLRTSIRVITCIKSVHESSFLHATLKCICNNSFTINCQCIVVVRRTGQLPLRFSYAILVSK